MAVYTPLTTSDLRQVLEQYDVGSLENWSEISAGIENSNFFVDTQGSGEARQSYVLTIFESLPLDKLPYFVALTQHLAMKGLPVPAPLQRRNGEYLFHLKSKPSLLLPKLSGKSLVEPGTQHCFGVGETLAHLHLATQSFGLKRESSRSLLWMKNIQQQVAARQNASDQAFLIKAINAYQASLAAMDACPKGTVHGDLFRDNVLFDDQGRVSGLIDFYHACHDSLLFDLAVVANDWTVDASFAYDTRRYQALLDGYCSVRPWTCEETRLWPQFLKLAALKFWLSRLQSRLIDGYQKSSTSGDKTKDPDEFKWLLQAQGL